jgi:hypothetical protein
MTVSCYKLWPNVLFHERHYRGEITDANENFTQ